MKTLVIVAFFVGIPVLLFAAWLVLLKPIAWLIPWVLVAAVVSFVALKVYRYRKATRPTSCPTCGTENTPDIERCPGCTRPLLDPDALQTWLERQKVLEIEERKVVAAEQMVRVESERLRQFAQPPKLPQPPTPAPPAPAQSVNVTVKADRPALRVRHQYHAMPFLAADHTGHAFIALILYWIAWLPGFIANLVFLSEANADKRRLGYSPSGRGCLILLLWVFFLIPLIGVALAIFTPIYSGLIEDAANVSPPPP